MAKNNKQKQESEKQETESVKPNPDDLLIPCMFTPQEDITPYELARLMHVLINRKVSYGDWNTLDTQVKGITRHLTIIKNQQENEPDDISK